MFGWMETVIQHSLQVIFYHVYTANLNSSSTRSTRNSECNINFVYAFLVIYFFKLLLLHHKSAFVQDQQ